MVEILNAIQGIAIIVLGEVAEPCLIRRNVPGTVVTNLDVKAVASIIRLRRVNHQ